MPPGPYSGCALPAAGAIPSTRSSVLFGPSRLIHASAVTCGAISSGIMKQNTSGFFARTSVSETSSANAVPRTMASAAPPTETLSVLRAARHTTGLSRTLASTPASSRPCGASASCARRAIGTTASRTTSPSSVANVSRSPRRAGISGIVGGRSAAEQSGKPFLVEFVPLLEFSDVDRQDLERCDIGESGRRLHVLPGGEVALRHCKLLSVLRQQEIDERARGLGIFRPAQDRGGLGDDRHAFGGKDKIDR